MKVYVVDGPNDKWWTKFGRRVKAHAEEAWCTTKKFCKEHKSEIITGSVIAAPIITALIKSALRSHNIAEAERIKTEYIYDPSLGHYWSLTRALSNSEAIELDARHQAGERIGDILQSMKVLK